MASAWSSGPPFPAQIHVPLAAMLLVVTKNKAIARAQKRLHGGSACRSLLQLCESKQQLRLNQEKL
jgi:hypothetical protein